MCKIHHLTCPHCLSALIISRRCDHLLVRRSGFDGMDNKFKPEFPSCPYFLLVPRIVRGYAKQRDDVGETEGKCHFCEKTVWYVFPEGEIVEWKWQQLREGEEVEDGGWSGEV